MPIIKFHVPDHPADDQALAQMADRIHEVCVGALQAQPDAVQLLIVPSRVLCGQPVYIEVLYREQPHRNAPVMAQLMQVLAAQSQAVFGATPRIRCIAVDQRLLHALH
ncbi:hypothetical protein [Hydrogenophaga electricum]|uniref:Uncharacterized protein n=1 Tax=Hydrogenophaga electricum TaxID=1230953 RepID=A0ABQ6C2X0_9BURK|nr:hypothetical protein [Hydrogenophaga electricum]GLS14089.1 hypothetical protein GCM10007935_15190 [Hydrogenophaga electricum]